LLATVFLGFNFKGIAYKDIIISRTAMVMEGDFWYDWGLVILLAAAWQTRQSEPIELFVKNSRYKNLQMGKLLPQTRLTSSYPVRKLLE
jgi:hypothetical protein